MLILTRLNGFGAVGKRKNYTTWNPSDKGATISLSNNNLTAAQSGGAGAVRAILGVSATKPYWEIPVATNLVACGIGNSSMILTASPGIGDANGWGWEGNAGGLYNNGTLITTLARYGNGDVLGFALDMVNGTLTFFKNNTQQSYVISGLGGTQYPAIGSNQNVTLGTANFGASAFTYGPPSGYLAGLYT